jgi:hydroxymethylbilane synthase
LAARRCGPRNWTWLHEGEIDFAVHCVKDVETIRPDWLTIPAILPREDVRDCLIGAPALPACPKAPGWAPAPRAARRRR